MYSMEQRCGNMRNLCMTVTYDGTAYYGFQVQPGGNTIQDHLEDAIRALTGETVKITGSGRTDAGVHARRQIFNFPTASQIPVERWCIALNSRLPSDIVVIDAMEVPLDFHSRYAAKRKPIDIRSMQTNSRMSLTEDCSIIIMPSWTSLLWKKACVIS